MYGDKVEIRDINGQVEVQTSFEDFYDDSVYTVIDKQRFGEIIGKALLDDDPTEDYMDNCNLIYEYIDNLLSEVSGDIFGYVLEYIENNQ